jgi:2-iminobutanoate/2-iminopropanoate deaminase
MSIRYVLTAAAPSPAGHYSQATVHGGVVYVAGQLPLDPATRELVPGGIEEQTTRTLANVRAVLEMAGSDLAHVLKMNVYVSDISLWGAVNATYAGIMGESRPARAVIPTRELKAGCLIEIDCIAALRE